MAFYIINLAEMVVYRHLTLHQTFILPKSWNFGLRGPKNRFFWTVFHDRNDCFKVVFGLFSQGWDPWRSKMDWNGCIQAFYALPILYSSKKLEIWAQRPPKQGFWDCNSCQKWLFSVRFWSFLWRLGHLKVPNLLKWLHTGILCFINPLFFHKVGNLGL